MLFAISQHEVSTLCVGFGYWSLEFRWDLEIGICDFLDEATTANRGYVRELQ
jgi:hypothetical protein